MAKKWQKLKHTKCKHFNTAKLHYPSLCSRTVCLKERSQHHCEKIEEGFVMQINA